MKTHTITAEQLKQWIAEEQWVTFVESEYKKIQVSALDLKKRVVHGGYEIVYEGYSETEAVDKYNSLVGFPKDEPKLSN